MRPYQRFGTGLGLLLVVGCVAPAANSTPPQNAPITSGPPARPLFAPAGAPWTILCLELKGPHRLDQIQQIADTLKRTPGIRAGEVFVRDESDGFARLYYGQYFRKTDPKSGKAPTPQKLVDDLKMIKELGSGPGQYFFRRALTVRMPTDDVGNPDWALTRAPGLYTLQVGVFEPSDEFLEFKRAAAEYCALLREKGYEAWYHHTPAASMVTVGSFGPEALVPQESGVPRYSDKVIALQQSDELLKYNLLNGAIYHGQVYAPGETPGKPVPVPSRLVEIPRRETLDP